jgi:hypothetical protein
MSRIASLPFVVSHFFCISPVPSPIQSQIMQPIEKQIEVLATKVDGIYQILDRLHQQIVLQVETPREPPVVDKTYPTVEVPESAAWLIHQDVLIDNEQPVASYHRSDNILSPQSQIQRLTAQLTVAYNRIAALEEQLLSRQLNNN